MAPGMGEVGMREVAIALLLVMSAVVIYWRPWAKAPVFLDKTRKKMKILDVRSVSPDTKIFRLCLGNKRAKFGLPIGKHIRIFAPNPQRCLETGLWNGKPDPDKGKPEISRTYTPISGIVVRPRGNPCAACASCDTRASGASVVQGHVGASLPRGKAAEGVTRLGIRESPQDRGDEARGYVELMIKCYPAGTFAMPDGKEVTWEDGGKLGRYLDKLKPGDHLEVDGPVGVHEYMGRGKFKVPGRMVSTKHICLMAGGVGITPILQIVNAVLQDPSDESTLTLLYANKTYADILAKEQIEEAEMSSDGRLKVVYTLDFPPEGWEGKKGFITAEMIRDIFVPPVESPAFVMCGPPPMIEYACKKNLEALGYPKDSWIAL